ncbi:hypothetical protein Pla108_16410 [Botrimarina colliarenosi]|uniref:AAA+ ATPase domain-containing protein n=1 Tax=Botrimarina colliarenosi TaxID=2528001 RepID=A0A5C6AN51_9BACT|nr:AAA family ATPase [Botrimarina colliarenosi]TWU00689.1 hypothetical protein Pla108_16410 [Botrimarina colliarenosi]
MSLALETKSSLESQLPPELAAAALAKHTVNGAIERPSGLLEELTSGSPPAGASYPTAPPEPRDLAETGLSEGLVDSLLLKALLSRVTATGGDLARQSCLSHAIVSTALTRMRDELLVVIKGQAGGDYLYQLSEAGHTRARQHAEHANYAEAAPVPLAAYERAIRAQAIGQTRVTIDSLRQAFDGLTVGDEMLSLIAQAVSDGRGLFLFGAPGNGKTTIAELLCSSFGKHLWIPRTVIVGTDLLRLYDESCHEPAEVEALRGVRYDRRWVLIKRPTVVVGGELTLEQLDPSFCPASGVSEAPVQMKANGGVLVIDDFGRQRVSSTELLNRLIVPLEKQFDYLSLASGRQARIPFEMLCVLSTNLEPRELVDEAFLRRIPYKVEVTDPSVEQFHELFAFYGERLGVKVLPGVVETLLATHYAPSQRAMRFCHPRDLLRQAKNYCVVHGRPIVADQESLGVAVRNYFAGL